MRLSLAYAAVACAVTFVTVFVLLRITTSMNTERIRALALLVGAVTALLTGVLKALPPPG